MNCLEERILRGKDSRIDSTRRLREVLVLKKMLKYTKKVKCR